MSATEGTQNVPRPLQRCCLGLLYYSQALEGQGKLPVCLGLPHTPTEHIRLDESKPVSQVNDFRFLCMGHSLYERPAASEQQQQQGKQRQAGPTSSQQHTHKLPYCEGLEVILGASVEATSAALAKAAAGARETAAAGHTLDAGVAASQSAAPASHAGPQRPHEDDLSAVLTSMFGKQAIKNWQGGEQLPVTVSLCQQCLELVEASYPVTTVAVICNSCLYIMCVAIALI
eukprot:GHRR01004767.1.p1 GENE.GHRR01004767.1~~GHRR01004767.1.p1  ORF type:complete len:230 (+),score=56.51 GHRR01004767.1:113-802(+)